MTICIECHQKLQKSPVSYGSFYNLHDKWYSNCVNAANFFNHYILLSSIRFVNSVVHDNQSISESDYVLIALHIN